MATVFINYRTGDGQDMAALLAHQLTGVFGRDQVFLDSAALPAGRRFDTELWRRLQECAVLVVLIGDNWLSIRDSSGRRRIDLDDDYVRREICESIKLNKVVLPVLLNAAPLPTRAELPSEIALLSQFQFRRLRAREAGTDTAEIIRVLREHIPAVDDGGDDGSAREINHASGNYGAVVAGSHGTANYHTYGSPDCRCGRPDHGGQA